MNLIKDYEFVFSGETLRGLILVIITSIVFTLYKQDLSTITDWKGWAIGLGTAALQAGMAFVFGRIPPSKPIQ